MSNLKNFGLVGVGTDVQFGKAGPRLINNAGTFVFRNAIDTDNVLITSGGLTATSGNVAVIQGNITLGLSSATFTISGDTTLSRQQAGVFRLNGTAAVMLPNGTAAQRPTTPLPAMVRFNDDSDTLEYYTGAAWSTVATGGNTANLQAEIDAIETALGPAISSTGIFIPESFTGSASGATSFTNAIQRVSNTADAAGALFVNVSGDTMTGTLVMSGAGVQVVLPNPPTIGTHAVNRDYVDARIAGLTWKSPVVAASTGSNVSTLSPPATLDGVTLVLGDRILLKDQLANSENVIYIFNGVGVPLSISPDTDTPAELVNATVFVSGGTVNGDTGWTQTGTLGGGTVQWVQFSGANTYVAGAGLTLVENTFNVGAGSGILVGADDVSIGLFSPSTGGLILTTDGTTRSSAPTARLQILLPAGGGLLQDATGLRIPTGGISNGQLLNSTITFTGTTGTDTVALGESMAIIGADPTITTTMGANSLSILLNTVTVAKGGTGLTSLTAGQILVGNGTNPVALDPDLAFNATTNALTVGTGTLTGTAAGDVSLAVSTVNGNITLLPNGTGTVIVGSGATGVIRSNTGQALVVRGTTNLSLESVTGSTTMILPAGTTAKVSISGPTPAQYATSLAPNDLVNRQYVDQFVPSGGMNTVTANISLSSIGAVTIGLPLPTGAIILTVRVNVTIADSGTGTLSVGKAGTPAAYMLITENDPQAVGLYIAETMVVESGSVQVLATVAGSPISGQARVMVEYT
jgi:hypothetical protein